MAISPNIANSSSVNGFLNHHIQTPPLHQGSVVDPTPIDEAVKKNKKEERDTQE